MTPETPLDPLDTVLQTLFADVQPAAGFEDRLISAVRHPHRLRLPIPRPVIKAAIAAAAVAAVGVIGYVGNQAISKSRQVAMAPQAPSTPSSVQNGSQVLYGDGRTEWMNSPFTGSQHDNIYTGQNRSAGPPPSGGVADKSAAGQADPLDSMLLPSDNSQVQEIEKRGIEKRGQPPLFDSTQDKVSLREPKPPVSETRILTGANPKRGQPPLNGDLSHDSLPASGDEEASPKPDYFSVPNPQNQTDRHQSQYLGNLVDGARHLIDEGKYSEALTTIGNIKKLDPNNAYANSVSEFVQDKADIMQQRKWRGGSDTELTHQLNDAVEKKIPYDDVLNYSADWPKGPAGQGQIAMADAKGSPQSQTPASVPVTSQAIAQVGDDRKIIRTGSMEFEVDRFDTAQMQISKIVGELGGFVGATDSTKLPNGKVRGSIAVRVAPERLDTLVLSLRALGDLKSQQITAADITKEYTDIQSELAADRAMQDRLLALIHDGKGSVKDLLAAENELGEWRTKIEKAEGMIRYYNAQVAMSTLTITLSERDIQTPAGSVETETADMGIEADDVEKSRDSALKAIDDAKGRIIEAQLKRLDAGQLAARLVADVPPESAGAVIDQLKQLGKVARLEVNRQTSATDGSNSAITPLKTERNPTRLLISIYNLANVAPRQTTNITLAASDVETSYAALSTIAKSTGGRVVTSNLDRGDPLKAAGSLVLEFPPDKFESAMTTLHAQGDVLKMTVTQNPDTQNSTDAKLGLTVQLIALASVPPREKIQQTLAAGDVPTAYQAVLAAINSAHGRVQSAQLNEQDRQNISADLQLEIPRANQSDFDKALAAAGSTIARTATQAVTVEGTVDSKVQVHLSIAAADHLSPRETTRLLIETPEIDKAATDTQAAVLAAGGRILESTVSNDHGKGSAKLTIDLPLDKSQEILNQLRNTGTIRGIDSQRDPQAPTGPMARAQIAVEFTTADAIVADQTGPWASIRQGLSTSISGLLWSLQWVVTGICLIGPWAVVGWAVWKVRGKFRNPKPTA